MKYLLNYAHLSHYNSQKKQTESAKTIGGFDHVFQCSFNDIDKDFYEKNKTILDQQKGAGFWLWKPHLIIKHLKLLNEIDFLFYLDSGAYFINKIDPLEKICREKTKGLLCFHINEGPFPRKDGTNYESAQTKRDVYIAMGCDNEDYWYNNYPSHAGMSGWLKNDFTLSFLDEWLFYAQMDIITDSPNKSPNLSSFSTHRHDQSIYSVLRKKYNIPSFTDPTQCGNSYREVQGNIIPETIYHHRDPS